VLTEAGAEVVLLLTPLCLWAEKNAKRRDDARARYDRGVRTRKGAPRPR
jgi:DNA-binding HxlR family transcriptional regulator